MSHGRCIQRIHFRFWEKKTESGRKSIHYNVAKGVPFAFCAMQGFTIAISWQAVPKTGIFDMSKNFID